MKHRSARPYRLMAVLLVVASVALSLSFASEGQQEEAYGRTPTRMVPYGRGVEPYRRLYLEPFTLRLQGTRQGGSGAPGAPNREDWPAGSVGRHLS